jgi:hypothetical protein
LKHATTNKGKNKYLQKSRGIKKGKKGKSKGKNNRKNKRESFPELKQHHDAKAKK